MVAAETGEDNIGHIGLEFIDSVPLSGMATLALIYPDLS